MTLLVRTAAIVQARFASTRLPGKALLPLGSRSVLAHVLARCAATPGVDVVCCATVTGSEGDAIATEALRCGASVVRGSEQDVLARYWDAAQAMKADVILRVTSDCPLIDPVLCSRVLKCLTAENADYACNNMPRSWPHGLDCEAFTTVALERAARTAAASDEREHVTPWLRSTPSLRRATIEGPGGELTRWRWTLDWPEDYDMFKRLIALLPQWPALPGWEEIAAIWRAHPEIAALNRARAA